MKTHTLHVVTADGTEERTVDSAARLLLKAGGDLQSWKVGDLLTVIADEFDDGARVLIVDSDGRGHYRRVAASARLEIGDARWPIHTLMAFRLALIPQPVAPLKPYQPGDWLVHFVSGEPTLLHGVERFEDVSGWAFDAGGLAVPPEQPGNGAVTKRAKAVAS